MRYSQIVGPVFYGIGMSPEHCDVVDVHFTAAAHHYWMLPRSESTEARQYHLARHRGHLRAMMRIIFLNGDFTRAKDESLRGLDERYSWNPDLNFSLPDPAMFNSMSADPACGVFEPHPSDWYLAPEELNGHPTMFKLAN